MYICTLGIFYTQAPVARPSLRVTTPSRGDEETISCDPAASQYGSKAASDRMLRRQSPWGLGGAVYLLICSFVRIHLFINVRGHQCFQLGVGGRWILYISARITQGWNRRTVQQLNYRGPTVVVFKISLSEIFLLPPIMLTTTTRSYLQLCDVSMLALLSLKTSRFVGFIMYRCRVRFQGPTFLYKSVLCLQLKSLLYI